MSRVTKIKSKHSFNISKTSKVFNFVFLILNLIFVCILFLVSSSEAQAANTNFTLSTWLKPQGSTTTMAVLVKDSEVRLITDASNRPACQIHDGASWQTAATSSKALSQNEWAHVACVYDGANLKVYVNGSEKASQAESSEKNDTANVFRIGSDASGTYNDWSGYIDEVKIYPYTRSADEIRQDYNAGLSGMSADKGAAVSFGGQSSKWLSDGLVGYWKFDEAATTSGAIDSSGNRNDGTYYGNASTTGGKFGNGVVLSGTSTEFIKVDHDNSLDPVNTITVSGWAKFTEHSKYNLIVSRRNGYNLAAVNTSNRAFFSVETTDNGVQRVDSNKAFTDSDLNVWYHYVGTYDGQEIKFYINGELEGFQFATGNITYQYGTEDLHIGDKIYSGGYFGGNLDEIRIYNKALSAGEVKKLYEWAPPAVMHLKMDEKSGTTAYDSSGNEYNGTLGSGTDTPSWSQGKFGGALDFDGSNDYVSNASFSIGEKESFTISLWIKENENLDEGMKGIISSVNYDGWTMTDSGWSISIGGSGSAHRLNVYAGDGVLGVHRLVEADVSGDYKWHHISFVFDRNEGYTHTYVDGIEDSDGSWDISNYGDVSGNRFSIGDYHVHHNGKIDDVRIYNYARTQKQILEDMFGGSSAGSGQARKSPVLHLNFDEGFGETVHDSSIYGNDGTAYVGIGGSQTATSSVWEKSGRVKGGIELDGTDDFIGVPDFDY